MSSSSGIQSVNPSAQSISISEPGLLAVSDPSIRVVKKNSRFLQCILILLVLFALAALAASIFFFIDQANKNKKMVEEQEIAAQGVLRVNANPLVIDDDSPVEAVEDESKVFLSLYTKPEGAEIYMDGTFIGVTPLDQLKLKKSDKTLPFIINLDGYEPVRQSFKLDHEISENFTLNKIIVQAPAAPVANVNKPNTVVTQNNAVVITNQPVKTKANNKKKKNGKSAPAMDIKLPD